MHLHRPAVPGSQFVQARPAFLQEHVANEVQVPWTEQEQHGVIRASSFGALPLCFLAGGKSESIDSWNNTSSLEGVGETPPAVRRRGELSWSADWNGGVDSIGRLGLTRLVDSSVGIVEGIM